MEEPNTELQRAVGLWMSDRYRLDRLIQHIAKVYKAQQPHPITRHGKLSVVWRQELSELFDCANEVVAHLQAEGAEAAKHMHSGTSAPTDPKELLSMGPDAVTGLREEEPRPGDTAS